MTERPDTEREFLRILAALPAPPPDDRVVMVSVAAFLEFARVMRIFSIHRERAWFVTMTGQRVCPAGERQANVSNKENWT